ncbi:MAG: hypothetical protein AABM42_01920 [Actinomycetota bacterium]
MTRWACDCCAVVVSFMDGHGPTGELPDGWAREHGALVCLGCRRLAVVAAVEARSRGIQGRDAARRALAEFELRRDDRYRGGDRVHGTYRFAGRTIELSRATVAEVRRQIAREAGK